METKRLGEKAKAQELYSRVLWRQWSQMRKSLVYKQMNDCKVRRQAGSYDDGMRRTREGCESAEPQPRLLGHGNPVRAEVLAPAGHPKCGLVTSLLRRCESSCAVEDLGSLMGTFACGHGCGSCEAQSRSDGLICGVWVESPHCTIRES